MSENTVIAPQDVLIYNTSELVFQMLLDSGVTQAELARRMNVSAASVNQMLSGERNLTLRSLANIADALDQSIEISARPIPSRAYRNG